eukprot:gnl/TRDRNA2_/TRDRNA2_126698_c4_seq1.p1 gnl/TRDRNA2_/TRDRNA2_126698_c4~~gnl/TRDRNA2_/TRDRNA2_126698_c4_seq1.p1  ORF type:complete len:127 (+),score=11.26 gnl/TRDRNA2_/TRDRNA2_126698_c4_seq1:2-382(+)
MITKAERDSGDLGRSSSARASEPVWGVGSFYKRSNRGSDDSRRSSSNVSRLGTSTMDPGDDETRESAMSVYSLSKQESRPALCIEPLEESTQMPPWPLLGSVAPDENLKKACDFVNQAIQDASSFM